MRHETVFLFFIVTFENFREEVHVCVLFRNGSCRLAEKRWLHHGSSRASATVVTAPVFVFGVRITPFSKDTRFVVYAALFRLFLVHVFVVHDVLRPPDGRVAVALCISAIVRAPVVVSCRDGGDSSGFSSVPCGVCRSPDGDGVVCFSSVVGSILGFGRRDHLGRGRDVGCGVLGHEYWVAKGGTRAVRADVWPSGQGRLRIPQKYKTRKLVPRHVV